MMSIRNFSVDDTWLFAWKKEKRMNWEILELLQGFFAYVAQGKAEIYNEFSLQYELGCYLRSFIVDGMKFSLSVLLRSLVFLSDC